MRRLVLAAAVLAAGSLLPGLARAERFAAVLLEDGHTRQIGVVDLDRQAHLTVVSSPPARSAFLHKLADEVNAEEVMHVDVAPPSGSPKYASVTAIIPRGDARFPAALRAHMKQYYDVTLRTP